MDVELVVVKAKLISDVGATVEVWANGFLLVWLARLARPPVTFADVAKVRPVVVVVPKPPKELAVVVAVARLFN